MARRSGQGKRGCWPRVLPGLLVGLWMVLGGGAGESCSAASPTRAAARAPAARGQPTQDPAAPWLQRREVVPACVLDAAENPAPRIDPGSRSWKRLLSAENFCVHCGRPVQARSGSCFFLLVGFAGQGLFGLRFFVQWLASERAQAVVIPESFWWISITAGLLTLVYAASILAWPILLGQGLNFVIYGRNLYFLRRRKGT